MTQTRDKLARERIRDQPQAIQTHEQVGREVRGAIERIGGTIPENLPPAEHIEQVAERIKGAAPKIELDDRDAKGLLGGR
jgi:DNA-damage-inducible protein D